MKKFYLFLFFVTANFVANAQCSTVAVQISSSDTSYIQLYHAGFFNIPSGFANIVEWEVTSFSGELIHEETTSGGANDQSRVIFDHSIPITDSMKATIVITNDTIGIICTMNDTLYWKETEVLPGSFIGNWDVLSSNGGVEEPITTSTDMIVAVHNIQLFPSLVLDHFEVKSDLDNYSFSIFDLNGRLLETHKNSRNPKRVDISHYAAGVYFVRFLDEKNRNIGTQKVVKM